MTYQVVQERQEFLFQFRGFAIQLLKGFLQAVGHFYVSALEFFHELHVMVPWHTKRGSIGHHIHD